LLGRCGSTGPAVFAPYGITRAGAVRK
jgi:hypothetical protein